MINVYSVVTGDKDNVENLSESVGLFKNEYDRFKDDRRNSRIQKILPHLYMNAEYSIYHDANIRLLQTPEELIEKHLKDYDIAVYKHPTRDCLYDEASKCAVLKLDDPEVIIEQVKAYEDNGYGKHKGLAECGVIFRRHTDKVREFNEAWWAHYCRYSVRDQISFIYVADMVGLPVNIINDFFIETSKTHAIKQSGDCEISVHNK